MNNHGFLSPFNSRLYERLKVLMCYFISLNYSIREALGNAMLIENRNCKLFQKLIDMENHNYIKANHEWLANKASEPGVHALEKGVYYKVIKSGDSKGAQPTRDSVVTVHYVGQLIDGKIFDSSRDGIAPAFRLRDLIPGWVIALTKMHVGDRWEVYIPSEEGYGPTRQDDIPGGSTLLFDIELLGVM